jgi:hypothetical protein
MKKIDLKENINKKIEENKYRELLAALMSSIYDIKTKDSKKIIDKMFVDSVENLEKKVSVISNINSKEDSES